MRLTPTFLCMTAALILSISLVGCDSESSETATNKIGGTPPALNADEDDHSGHDHSAHAHPTEGPHGGHLIELGNEEYHAELLHDEDTHTVTIHLLDSAGTQPVAVPLSEITLQLFRDGQFVKHALSAVRGPEDTANAWSQFAIADAELCDALCHEEHLRGRLQVTINEKPYTGTIEHSSHDGHAHGDHEGHDH
jgi:hypothetical protein